MVLEVVNDMKKRKPAQIRYDEKWPTVSVRLDSFTKARLAQYTAKRGISFADFIKEALGVKIAEEDLAEERYTRGYEDGCLDGMDYGRQEGEKETLAEIRKVEVHTKCPHCGCTLDADLSGLRRIDEDGT
jgi:flagellar biosynthesis/type III secretory pathway protein FliH